MNRLKIAANWRRRLFPFAARALSPSRQQDADQEQIRREKMAKMLSLTATTLLVVVALVPAFYTYAMFA